MPTGYTSLIYENKNVSFKDFVLTCARAFGPCMHQRDDDMRDKPKLREPSIQYHLDAIKAAKKNSKPSKTAFNKYKKDKIEEYKQHIQEKKQLKERYQLMLNQVQMWTPPTSDHDGLKEFMINQLNKSIEFDCSVDGSARDLDTYTNMTYEDYVAELKKSSDWEIKYHTERLEEEKKHAEFANKWILALYDNLNNN